MSIRPLHTVAREQPFLSISIGFVLLFIGFKFINALGLQWICYVYDISTEEMMRIMGEVKAYRAHRQMMLAIVAIIQMATWGFAGVLMMWLMIGSGTEISRRTRITLFAGVLMMFTAIPLIQVLAFDAKTLHLPDAFFEWEESIKQREKESTVMIEAFIATTSPRDFLVNILILALVPAICEEMFFRGFLQKALSFRFHPLVALVLAAFIFSFLHFQFYGFFSRFLLGCVLGYVFYLSDNVLPGIIAHFAYNSLMVLVGYIYTVSGMTIPEGKGIPFPWYWVLVSAILLGIVAWNTWKAVKSDNVPSS